MWKAFKSSFQLGMRFGGVSRNWQPPTSVGGGARAGGRVRETYSIMPTPPQRAAGAGEGDVQYYANVTTKSCWLTAGGRARRGEAQNIFQVISNFLLQNVLPHISVIQDGDFIVL